MWHIIQLHSSNSCIGGSRKFYVPDDKISIGVRNCDTSTPTGSYGIILKNIRIIDGAIAPGTGPFTIGGKISIAINGYRGMGW